MDYAILSSLKAEYERDLIFAQAKVQVINDLLAKAEVAENAETAIAEEAETENSTSIY